MNLNKGHERISFKDTLGVDCKIAVEWHKLKFVVYSNRQLPDYATLTQEQVRELLPYLQSFAETGKLGIEGRPNESANT